MDRCKPEDMRNALILVDEFRKAGIGFIAIPYSSEEEMSNLVDMADRKLDEMIKEAEG